MRSFFTLFLLASAFLATAQQSGTFTVGGSATSFYPVRFSDGGWNLHKTTVLELGRSNVHTDASWRGSLMATFRYHVSNWGNGSEFIEADLRSFATNNVTSMVGGWKQVGWNGNIEVVIWLKGGNTTYQYSANVTVNPLVYDGTQHTLPYVSFSGEQFAAKTTIDDYVLNRGKTLSDQLYVLGDGTNYIAGKLGIGAKPLSTNVLVVKGDALFTKVKVKDFVNWPDYVFADDYQLRSLQEVKQFIAQYKHLPEVPSAAAIAKEGIDVSETQAVLLKKIEELTLYLLQHEALLTEQRALINAQQAQLAEQQQQLDQLTRPTKR